MPTMKPPRREVAVCDPFTTRHAGATATARDNHTPTDWITRSVKVKIEVGHADTKSSEAYVYCEARTLASGEPAAQTGFGSVSPMREWSIEHLQLGDLPLLCLALQEAIRVGVERAAFPEIRGGKKS